MENEHVLSGLIRKRAETAGLLDATQMQVRQLILDVDNLDATIRMFNPDIDLPKCGCVRCRRVMWRSMAK